APDQPTWCDQILILDGGSTDGTVEWCRLNGFEVYEQKRKGIRYAYLEIMPLVSGDVVLTLSPGGNCPVEAIPRILAAMGQGFSLVIGSRYMEGVRSEDDDFLTGIANWVFTRTVNVLHGGHYTSSEGFRRNSDIRLMNCSVRVPEFTIPPVVATSFACEGITALGSIRLMAKAASAGPVTKLSLIFMTTRFTPKKRLRIESISCVQPVSPDRYTLRPFVNVMTKPWDRPTYDVTPFAVRSVFS